MPTIIDGVNGVSKVAPGAVIDISLNTSLEDTLVRTTEYPGYNYIINGNFDIWQRGTTQTFAGYYCADRWFNAHIGSTKTVSRQPFTIGSTFPDGEICPDYFYRTVVSSVTAAGNYVQGLQRVESVKTLAGKKATLSFYAKANAVKNMSIDAVQNFGTGGSPSVRVTGISVNKVALSTLWQRYTILLDIPSIAGKTLGTAGDDSMQIYFWFDAGTDFNSRTDTLGHQSGTFDIAQVALVEGDKDINPIPRSIGEEFALCQRYYQAKVIRWCADVIAGTAYFVDVPFICQMRANPAVTSAQGGFSNGNMQARSANQISRAYLTWGGTANSTGPSRGFSDSLYMDAEL